MGYNLFLYTQKGSKISKDKISNYLSTNLVPANEDKTQWFFENKDTDVYYGFIYTNKKAEPIENFDETGFVFNINFVRPNFFGLEAFKFVEKFCNDLNLFVSNPQSDSDLPYKPNKQEQFDIWNKTNLMSVKINFAAIEGCYLSEEECKKVWEYNSNRGGLQEKLGDGYFVPKIFFFKKRQTNKPFTFITWTEHVPFVLPTTDYILLNRSYKKFFTTVSDSVLVSRTTLLKVLEKDFDNFDFPNCKIMHQNRADKVKNKFNSIKAEEDLKGFEKLPIESLCNTKPD